ncbi:MAG: energy transducer TonB [Polyangiales bacterium]
MPQATGPKVLRIGKVQGGRVIEERVIKQRTHVTIGSSHTNMFLASGQAVPESMKLFELVGSDYVLNMTDAMTGRVALPTGVTDVVQARASGAAKRVGNYFQLKLTEDSRGKVVVGETTFLFQFVAPPPIQPKPQLPLAVQGGLASQIDWGFTIIAAFSFLLHFGLAGAVNSDWFDPLVDEDGDTLALIQAAKDRPVIPPEEPKDKADPNAGKDKDKVADAPKAEKKAAAPVDKGAAAAAAAAHAAKQDKAAAALSNELDQLSMQALGSLGGAGPAQSSIMKAGATAADSSLDQAAAQSGGVRTGDGLRTGGGGGPMGPGGAGGHGLGGLGSDKTGDGGSGGGGDKSAAIKAPIADASVGAATGGSNVPGVDATIARIRWKFKTCLTKAQQTDPTAGGTIKVTVRVGEGGDSSASLASSDASSTLTQCVVGALQGVKFSPPDGGSATFVVPVVLKTR